MLQFRIQITTKIYYRNFNIKSLKTPWEFIIINVHILLNKYERLKSPRNLHKCGFKPDDSFLFEMQRIAATY